jgi:hypothetical protein
MDHAILARALHVVGVVLRIGAVAGSHGWLP